MRPAGGPPPKRPYGGRLLPPWIPLPVRAWLSACMQGRPQKTFSGAVQWEGAGLDLLPWPEKKVDSCGEQDDHCED
jgi:hypothetical protein